MLRFSTGWLAILCLAVFVYSGCEDDEGFDGGPFIGTITDIASGDPQFSTLTSALERTGLDDFLDVPNRTLTVFAPTDAAFQAAGIDLGTVSDDALADILRYHVLGSSVRSADIAAGTSSAATLNTTGPGGEALPLRLDLNGSDLALNRDINVTTFDVEAVNGVIHIIDNVLLPPSILDRARIDGRFGTLITALERTGLDATVSGEGDFTVFAPTDDAFQASGIDLGMVSDDDLRNLLLYHVVGSAIPAGSIAAGDNFVASLDTTGPGNSPLSLLVNNTGGNVQVNDSSDVVVADVFATNGVIHAVDAVLGRQSIVDFAVKAEGTSELESALGATNLVGALNADGPFTVFAPVDAAFMAAMDTIGTLSTMQVADVLQYHVVSGNVRSSALDSLSVPTLNMNDNIEIRQDTASQAFFILDVDGNMDSTNVNFILTDIQGTNGVIHLIDAVLLPEDQ